MEQIHTSLLQEPPEETTQVRRWCLLLLSLVLMMWLPGEKAETVCTKAAEIFISLLPEIQAHANSDAPINDMTRAETTWK